MPPLTPQFIQHLRRLVRFQSADPSPDADLLERFARDRDEAAFAMLVARHGPMVMRVARRAMDDVHIAEDVFQATFLVLARKAGAVRRPTALAGYMHGVAVRVARKARARRQRNGNAMAPVELAGLPDPHPDQLTELSVRELLTLLDEEVQRLPEVYRLPMILCYLEGLSKDEAARRLGWTAGAVRGRLERGRARLQARLARRGVTLSAVLLIAASAEPAATAIMPASLAATAQAAVAFASGKAASSAGVTAEAAALAWQVLAGMAAVKLKILATLLVLAGGMLAAGAGLLAQPNPGSAAPKEQASPQPAAARALKADAAPLLQRDVFGDALPEGAIARMGTFRLRHGPRIRAAVFSTDGSTLVTLGQDGFARVWDAATGAEVRRFRPEGSQVAAIARGPGGAVLALAGSKGGFRLWDVTTGKRAGAPMNYAGPATWNVSSDAKVVIAANTTGSPSGVGEAGAVRVWDAATGKQLCQFVANGKGLDEAQLSADGRLVAAVSSREKSFHLWDVASGKRLHECLWEGGGLTGPLAFAPNGRQIAMLSGNRQILVWEAATGKITRRFDQLTGHGMNSLAYTSEGRSLVSGGDRVRIWDVTTGKVIRELEPLGRSSQQVALAPDNKVLASWGGTAVYLWDLDTGRRRGSPGGHRSWVNVAALSADGRRLATACFGEAARLWDVESGRELRQFRGHPDEGTAWVAFAPKGNLLATADSVDSVRLWRSDTGEEVRRIAVAKPMKVAFSRDGAALLTVGWGGQMYLWDPLTGKEVRQFPAPPAGLEQFGGGAVRVAFSPDGTKLASFDTGVRLWDVATAKVVRNFVDGSQTPGPVAFSPDGRLLATGWHWYRSPDGTTTSGRIGLFEVETGKELSHLVCEGVSNISAVAFSPDGKFIAGGTFRLPGPRNEGGEVDSWQDEGEVVLWDLASGKKVKTFVGHRGSITSVTFTPDGRRLVTSSSDTTALVWRVPVLPRTQAKTPPLSAEQRDKLWTGMTSVDAAQGWRAVWELVAAPEDAVALLRDRLRPAAVPDKQRVARLLVRLEANQFKEREQASAELNGMGEMAAPLLRRALESAPSLELERQIRQLLTTWEGPTPERLVAIRATTVLEQIDSPAARQILDSLAKGAAEAKLTREAKASLERLVKQTATR